MFLHTFIESRENRIVYIIPASRVDGKLKESIDRMTGNQSTRDNLHAWVPDLHRCCPNDNKRAGSGSNSSSGLERVGSGRDQRPDSDT